MDSLQDLYELIEYHENSAKFYQKIVDQHRQSAKEALAQLVKQKKQKYGNSTNIIPITESKKNRR